MVTLQVIPVAGWYTRMASLSIDHSYLESWIVTNNILVALHY